MSRIEHTLGTRFGRLVIVSAEPKRVDTDTKCLIAWKCRCDCGTERYYKSSHLHRGKTKSCGCLRKELKGQPSKYKTSISSTPGRLRAYRSWECMKKRCLDAKDANFKDYGARGIMICQRWLDSFDNFFDDLGERPRGLSIGRIDNDGNYEPGNCRWETTDQQANNTRRTLKIRGKPLALFCKDKGYNPGIVRGRIASGWGVKKALETPVSERAPYTKGGRKEIRPVDKYYKEFSAPRGDWRVFCGLEGAPVFFRDTERNAKVLARAINQRQGQDREDFLRYLED